MSGDVPVVGPGPCADRDACPVGVGAGVRGGARGWNADQFGRVDVLAGQYGPWIPRFVAWGRVWNAGGSWMRVVGTLLGPEGTGRPGRCGGGVGWLASEGFMLVVPLVWFLLGPGGVWRWGMWSHSPYVENCTVDASI